MIKSKKLKGKGIYNKTVNYFTGSNLKDGEMHAVIYDPKAKKYTTANYTGPGTKLLERLKAGDQPKVKSDKVSQAHDIRYTLSKDIEGIKSADSKMVNKLKELQKNKEDSNFNIRPAKWGIQANQVLGKILPDKYYDKFINYLTNYKKANEELSKDDKSLLESKLKELESEGYGFNKPKKARKRRLKKKI